MTHKRFNLVGARIIKTGIAVALALYICSLLQISPRVFAAVSAVMNIQPSIYRSFKNAIEQVLTHVISVGIAVVGGYLFGTNPVTIGLITIVIITTIVRIKLLPGVAMGVVAAIFVLDAPHHDFLNHALTRSYVVFIGLGTALMVNSFLPQPRYKDALLNNLAKLNKLTANFFHDLVQGFINLNPISDAEFESRKKEIKELLRLTRTQFELHKEQSKYQSRLPYDIQEKWEKYLDYNVKLYYKSQELHDATKQRIEWRKERGDPPISTEFKMVLGMLERGINSFISLNGQLYEHIYYGKPLSRIPINEQFWEEFSYFIDRWHVRMTGSSFLHAFMYVSVVANHIKWASRSIKEFSQNHKGEPSLLLHETSFKA